MKLQITRNRLIVAALFLLALLAGLLPFIRISDPGIMLNFFKTSSACIGAAKGAVSSVPEFGRAAQNLNSYVFYYVPVAAVLGILMSLFYKHAFKGTLYASGLGLLWTASLLFVLKTGKGGEALAIGTGALLMLAVLLMAVVASWLFQRSETAGAPEGRNAGKANSVAAKYGLMIIIIAICLELSVLSNVFLTGENWINLLRQVSINGIMAMGMTFVIITGGIDLSVGSMLSVSGVIIGSIVSVNPEMVLPAVLLAVVVTSVFGLCSGSSISQFKMPPFIVTLAMTTIARGFSLVYANGRPYIITSPQFAFLGKGSIAGIPVPVIVFALVTLFMYILLSQTKTGRYIFAVGGNENAARISGVNVKRVKILVYTVSGLLAGIAGAILASRISSGQPAIGEGYETDAIAAAVIGGTRMSGGVGSVFGTILGVLIIGLISNGLTLLGVNSYWQQIVKGCIIFGAVLLDLTSKSRKA